MKAEGGEEQTIKIFGDTYVGKFTMKNVKKPVGSSSTANKTPRYRYSDSDSDVDSDSDIEIERVNGEEQTIKIKLKVSGDTHLGTFTMKNGKPQG